MEILKDRTISPWWKHLTFSSPVLPKRTGCRRWVLQSCYCSHALQATLAFLNELPCTGRRKKPDPQKNPKQPAAHQYLSCAQCSCFPKSTFSFPLWFVGRGGRGCGIYPAFTNKTKIKLNSFYFNLHRLWLFNLHKYGLQEVLNFSCPGLKLVESKI